MSKSGQLRVAKTRDIPVPNAYILALQGEYADWAFDEVRAPEFKGVWRDLVFRKDAHQPLDLEIGTGNGTHFAHHAKLNPERNLLGIELKYKPLIQSIRRVRRDLGTNARVLRYNAYLLHEIFCENELNDVFIFFPDPWEKSRNHKHRLIQDEFLAQMFKLQRAGSRVFFKTDSRDYFQWALKKFVNSPYEIENFTFDLHQVEQSVHSVATMGPNPPPATPLTVRQQNFITQFESIFTRKKVPIGYAQLAKT